METTEMMKKMATTCKVLNNVLRDVQKYDELKRQYEIAVEQRNFTGVELIDRNDELCILHEKNNMLAKIMTRGNSAMTEKEEEIRMANLELAEVQRRLAAVTTFFTYFTVLVLRFKIILVVNFDICKI